MSEIIIKVNDGNTIVTTNTDELVEVNETPDGVNFVLKGSLTIQFMDPYMPSSAKQVIKNTADHMKGKKIVFEPDNPKRPAMIVSD
jgi:hypothetical protein